MNKKGFLLGEQTLKVIIAVLAILLLVFLLFKLYSNFTGKKDLEQAESTLNRLVDKLWSLNEDGSVEFVLLEPTGWRLIFLRESINNCKSDSCLCVCKRSLWFNKKRECEKKGICKDSQLIVEINEKDNMIKIGRKDLLLKKQDGKYIIKEK